VLGVIFAGSAMPDTERAIVEFGRVKRLGHVPLLARLDSDSLRAAFEADFDRRDFESAYE
jgi:dethiobiotin synthetase